MFQNPDRKWQLICLLMLSILLIGLMYVFSRRNITNNNNTSSERYYPLEVVSGDKKVTLKVELAKTPEELRIGLMGRTSLDKDSGMLFMFEAEASRAFWMKNTLIPLDIIFIDENYHFINVARNAQPCLEKEVVCPTYQSLRGAKYVLETNPGRLSDEILNTNTVFVFEN